MSQLHTAQKRTVPRNLHASLRPAQVAEEPSGGLAEATRRALVLRYRIAVRDRLEEREMVVDHSTSTAVYSLAQELGAESATPRDVVDIHVSGVREWAQRVNTQRSAAIVSAAESVLIETLGQLAAYYRAAALSNGRAWRNETTA